MLLVKINNSNYKRSNVDIIANMMLTHTSLKLICYAIVCKMCIYMYTNI
jgi:hypothetical protein